MVKIYVGTVPTKKERGYSRMTLLIDTILITFIIYQLFTNLNYFKNDHYTD